MKISHYWREIYITEGVPLGGDSYAYCMDNHPERRGGKFDIPCNVGLATCHCCDYFSIEGDKILFIEITDLLRKKQNFKKDNHSLFQQEVDGETEKYLFGEFVVHENTMKMYGSMLVLCWAAHECDELAKRLDLLRKRKCQYEFLLSVPCEKHDTMILDKLRFDVEEKLKKAMLGRTSNRIVACVLRCDELKDRIKSGAVPPT